MHYLIIVISI